MGVLDIFSKRKAREHGGEPILQTEVLPAKLRTQICHILQATLGHWKDFRRFDYITEVVRLPNEAWLDLYEKLLNEFGMMRLAPGDNPSVECLNFVLNAQTDQVLDLVETAFGVARFHQNRYAHWVAGEAGMSKPVDGAISEFNTRCEESGVGYRFVHEQIVTIASTFTHTELVEPALVLLHEKGYEGAHAEFQKAFAHLRKGDTAEAVNEACKAFESAMKTICERKGWAEAKGKTAKPLVDVLFNRKLIPDYMQTAFGGLRSLLDSGLPTVRNKEAAHGAGAKPVSVPREVAEYAIHQAASNILFLVKLAEG